MLPEVNADGRSLSSPRDSNERNPIETGNEIRDKVLSQKDLYEILPFGRTKIQQLISARQLPLVKVGNDYITTYKILEEWIGKNIGNEIFY